MTETVSRYDLASIRARFGARLVDAIILAPLLVLDFVIRHPHTDVVASPTFKAKVRRTSPAGKLPVLIDGDLVVWDTLAIAEYVAEKFPDRGVWPAERAARALVTRLVANLGPQLV